MTKRNNLIGSLILTLCAMIWGSSFVAQSTGAQFVGPFTFIGLRSLLGAAFLVPIFFIKNAATKRRSPERSVPADRKKLLRGGVLCGLALFAASVLQQFGIDRGTSSGKAGFITALYILLVPIFSVVLKKKIRPIIWPCALAALCGLYLLCVKDSSIRLSDLYVLACAIVYAIHILVIDRVAPELDGIQLSCVQFFVAGVLCIPPMLLTETVSLDLLKSAAWSIAYSGIMSSGVAFTLQILGQQRTEPTIASMLMSLESVFAMLTGLIVLHEIPTLREALGCVLMFAAIIVAQLPNKKQPAVSLTQSNAAE